MTPLLLLLLIAIGASRAADYPNVATPARGAPVATIAPRHAEVGAGGGSEGREAQELTVLRAGEAPAAAAQIKNGHDAPPHEEPPPPAREKPPAAAAATGTTASDAEVDAAGREMELPPRADTSAASAPAAPPAARAPPRARAPAPLRSLFPSDLDNPLGHACRHVGTRRVHFDGAALAEHCGGEGRETGILCSPLKDI